MAPNDSRVNIDALTIYMRNKLEDSTSPDILKHYIYRVNKKFRKINPYAYTPEIVSIGPFHRKQGSLRSMEEHKLQCVKTFLPTEGSHIQQCIEHMATLLEDTRSCYESIKLDNNAFVEMMILDGFFIIDLFQKYDWQKREARQNDPLLNNLWSIASLKRDILLLENQIPMRVLVHLLMFTNRPQSAAGSSSSTVNQDATVAEYNTSELSVAGSSSSTVNQDATVAEYNTSELSVAGSSSSTVNQDATVAEYNTSELSVTKLSLRFFDGLIMPEPYDVSRYGNLKGEHLLDLLGNTLHPAVPLNNNINNPKTNWKSVPSVTELTMAGVKFKKGLPTDRLLDIKYLNGTIEIPPIVIHDLTETLLRNLIAYEQCSHQKENYMISYAFFMDSLINSEEDVQILSENEIIVTALGNNREVCDLFNTLCNEATLENFYYSGICNEVNTYYYSRTNRWRAKLYRDYFQTPWSIISVIAAVLLLILTVIQTCVTVFQVSDDKTTKILEKVLEQLNKTNTAMVK